MEGFVFGIIENKNWHNKRAVHQIKLLILKFFGERKKKPQIFIQISNRISFCAY